MRLSSPQACGRLALGSSRVASSRCLQTRVISQGCISRNSRTPTICAALDQCHDQQVVSQPGAVIGHLVGKKLLSLHNSHSTVPLLHPLVHSLPFAASLDIYSSNSNLSSAPARHGALATANPLVELHYVISGSGFFTDTSTGAQQSLWPGDSVISLHGSAAFAAGVQASTARHSSTLSQPEQQHSSPTWSQLLTWLQELHTKHTHGVLGNTTLRFDRYMEQQQQQELAGPAESALGAAAAGRSDSALGAAAAIPHSVAASSQQQLVMLRLLLPSELLTGELLAHHAGHCHEVAEHLHWGPAAAQHAASPQLAAAAGSIDEDWVCGLLAAAASTPVSASHAASHHQQQQQHDELPLRQWQEQQQHLHVSATHATTAAASPQPSSSTRRSSSSTTGPSCPLTSLLEQQAQKRALADVGAFRLPQQTNRLALLFGPHASPAVSLSFGVEVFEPGHVTPLHTHSTAHELFFVLAGKGEAVFGPGQAGSDGADGSGAGGVQRVAASPGDVAVFPPGVIHGVDNPSGDQLYCLQMMLPNEAFVEWVCSGEAAGSLDVLSVQRLAAAARCG